jgi:hypothetical protein
MFVNGLKPVSTNYSLAAALIASFKDSNSKNSFTALPCSFSLLKDDNRSIEVFGSPPYDIRLRESVVPNYSDRAVRLTKE